MLGKRLSREEPSRKGVNVPCSQVSIPAGWGMWWPGTDWETAQRVRVSHPLSLPSLTLLEARLMLGNDSSVTCQGPAAR